MCVFVCVFPHTQDTEPVEHVCVCVFVCVCVSTYPGYDPGGATLGADGDVSNANGRRGGGESGGPAGRHNDGKSDNNADAGKQE